MRPLVDSGALDRRHASSFVRIALSGTHAVGKSTLAADLHEALPTYKVIAEPYYELLDEGEVFADNPSVDDFVAQLERSIARLTSDLAADILCERCPADFLAYLGALRADDSIREWLVPAGDALNTLDLVVFVPIEQPDRIAGLPRSDRLRRPVDALLREILIEDSYGFTPPAIAVHGSEDARVKQVLAALKERGP